MLQAAVICLLGCNLWYKGFHANSPLMVFPYPLSVYW